MLSQSWALGLRTHRGGPSKSLAVGPWGTGFWWKWPWVRIRHVWKGSGAHYAKRTAWAKEQEEKAVVCLCNCEQWHTHAQWEWRQPVGQGLELQLQRSEAPWFWCCARKLGFSMKATRLLWSPFLMAWTGGWRCLCEVGHIRRGICFGMKRKEFYLCGTQFKLSKEGYLKRNFCARNNCFGVPLHVLEVMCVNECSPDNMKSEIIKEPSYVLRKHDFS